MLSNIHKTAMVSYPIIKIPKGLNDIIHWNPLMDNFPKKPLAPEKPDLVSEPPMPSKSSPPQLHRESAMILNIFLIFIIFYLFGLSDRKDNEFLSFLALAGIVFLVYNNVTIYNRNEKIQSKYEWDILEYPKVVEKWKTDCSKLRDDHNYKIQKSKDEYEKSLEDFNKRIIRIYDEQVESFSNYLKSDDAVKKLNKLKIDRLNSYLEKYVTTDTDYSFKQNPTQGVSEQSFYESIRDALEEYELDGVKVFKNKTVESSKYLPDITLLYPIGNHKIYIDIEIDEPYVGATGKPIHYLESQDNTRDDFFIKNGWIVIRFAEEQVVNKPTACLQLILKVISSCRRHFEGDWLNYVNRSRNDNSRMVPLISKWTKEEAHTMAFKRYRNTYLSKDFIENLKIENSSI